MNSFFSASKIMGSDDSLVQAMGGNTSIKDESDFWVKASGTRLDEASAETFVRLDLAHSRMCLTDESLSLEDGILETSDHHRPSIETSLHAILPHRYVAHAHAVNAIAVSIQPRLDDAVEKALQGISWARIPYCKPGTDLATLIQRVLDEKAVDMILLENHGIVVGAGSPDKMLGLVYEVEQRLNHLVRPVTPHLPDIARLDEAVMAQAEFEPASNVRVHTMAFDDIALTALAEGTLYPDHAVLLGPGVVIVESDESVEEAVTKAQSSRGAAVHVAVIPGAGVLIRRSMPQAAHEMMLCLADVTLRLTDAECVRILSTEDVHELINWEAERYRLTQTS